MNLSAQSFQEVSKLLIKGLSSRRMRDVIERRYGLRGGRRHTLDAIGKEYKITRERVRQIESEALKQLRKAGSAAPYVSVFQACENHLRSHGSVMADHHLLSSLAESKTHSHISFLLEVHPAFYRVPETDSFYHRWTLNPEMVSAHSAVMRGVIGELEQIKNPVSKNELFGLVARHAKSGSGIMPEAPIVMAHIAARKDIRQNPYGEYGLASWPSICPRGVRDKAYVVLSKNGKPMHFRAVASVINDVGWSKRKAHPQTVHNELIKDDRFVLVGRGLYALKEWGYETGTVKDVMAGVLRYAGRPLLKDEIVARVLEKRMVKVPTILLNLQSRAYFKRTDDGKYTLI